MFLACRIFPSLTMCHFYLFIIAPIQLILAAGLCGILAAGMTGNNHDNSLITVSRALKKQQSTAAGYKLLLHALFSCVTPSRHLFCPFAAVMVFLHYQQQLYIK